MEVDEVLRRAEAGESQRAIAPALGVARNTVAAYLRGARFQPETSASRTRRPPGRAPGESTPAQARLKPYTEQIGNWVQREHLQLTRVQELLAQHGIPTAYVNEAFAQAHAQDAHGASHGSYVILRAGQG